VLGAAGFIFHFHAQAADVDIHDLDIAEIPLAPNAFQDLFAHQGSAGVAEKQLHDLEFHLGQVNGLAGFVQHAAFFIQHKGAADQLIRLGACLFIVRSGAAAHSAGQRFHAGHQLRH